MYEGKRYDLRHAHPKRWDLFLPCGTRIPAHIHFSSHCYTDTKVDPSLEQLEIKDYHGNPRFFCTKRYRLSLNLERWIKGWTYEICFYRKDAERGSESWAIVESDDGTSVKVAFSMSKHRTIENGVFIHIKTLHAYDRTREPTLPHPHLPYSVLLKGMAIDGKRPQLREKREAVTVAQIAERPS